MMPTELLQELLRVDSTNPPGNEEAAANMLEGHLAAAGVGAKIVRSPQGRPSLIGRIPGRADRAALVLLSHTDVVPVERERWTRDPFGGEIADGAIWGRGALDMKGIAVMHAEAVAQLSRAGTSEREVIFVSVADEETGGGQGAA
ncbi:MAG: M20/M25/M40 family metallo-hydrolase, partial [Actinomycetota bacterium]|nr:M20/M25/M40 family metallo-hydrolase [Actinomycetota bacterium]